MDSPSPRYEIVAIEQEQDARHAVRVRPAADFGQLWQGAESAADEWMQRQWDKLRDAWLQAKREKSRSEHTVRNYQRVWHRWADFVAEQRRDDGYPLRLWQVEVRHVREWQRHLREEGRLDEGTLERRGEGLAESTVNHHLSVVSSFYSFVINEKFMISGRELCLFVDITGAARANPFKFGNIARGKTEQYERACPLSPEDLGALVRYLEGKQGTLAGARNYALVLTYLLTGWRNHEVLRMQWKHVRPSRAQKGSFIYAWRGKGGKTAEEPIPQDAWHAIVHYLKMDGRWMAGVEAADQPLEADEYIFRPVVEHTLGQLANVKETLESRPAGAPLSEKSALRIVRTALKNAGVREWERYRVHDLRHTFARLLLEDGVSETEIMTLLHHSSLATTGLYTKKVRKKLEDPVDTRTGRLYQQIRAF